MSLQKCIGGYVYIIVQLCFGMGITLQRFYLFTTNQFISFFFLFLKCTQDYQDHVTNPVIVSVNAKQDDNHDRQLECLSGSVK